MCDAGFMGSHTDFHLFYPKFLAMTAEKVAGLIAVAVAPWEETRTLMQRLDEKITSNK